MNDISTPMMNLLEKALDVTSERHKLVVANMANVDTPGYHAKDLDFRSELNRAVAAGDSEGNFLPSPAPSPDCSNAPTATTSASTAKGCCWRKPRCSSA